MRLDGAPESGNVIDSRGMGGKLALIRFAVIDRDKPMPASGQRFGRRDQSSLGRV